MRVGIGYDIHRLVEGRPLTIGGITVPYERGLAGHSDGDVLCHAIADALLGAAALGDIGTHFPDTDPKYEGADSAGLLAKVAKLVGQEGFQVINVDTIIIAEEPKFAPYIEGIRSRVAAVLNIEVSAVSVKATTNEGLGPIGEGEAIAAWAVVALAER
ncbi:MAG: 2-C-methyl-D-erythritol 2,4-cyclodiphosphate synthase [Candidatus Coatesbacteria bacterium]|nr:MAG: 2-C-methyl-D-erythritol 2,4-cyclodiphosphate synthase [Candidatus Coatesbacteria bacterium]